MTQQTYFKTHRKINCKDICGFCGAKMNHINGSWKCPNIMKQQTPKEKAIEHFKSNCDVYPSMECKTYKAGLESIDIALQEQKKQIRKWIIKNLEHKYDNTSRFIGCMKEFDKEFGLK